MELKGKVELEGALLKGKAPGIIQTEFDRAMEEAASLLQREIKELTPVGVHGASGGLLGSIQMDVIGKGTPLIKGIVASAHKYAEPVEKGTVPHFPPVEPIQQWVKQKLHIAGEKHSREIAFLIARKISRKGTKAQAMFDKGFDNSLPRLQRIFERAGFRITKRLES